MLRRPSGRSRGAAGPHARDAAPLPPAGRATGSGRGPGEEAGDGGGPGATPARRSAQPSPAPGCSAAAGDGMEPPEPGARSPGEPVRVPGPGRGVLPAGGSGAYRGSAGTGTRRSVCISFPSFTKPVRNHCLERWERAGSSKAPEPAGGQGECSEQLRPALGTGTGAAPPHPARASHWKSSCGFS